MIFSFNSNRIEEAKRAIKRPHDRHPGDRYEERDRDRDREPERKRPMSDRSRFEPPPPPRFDSSSTSRFVNHTSSIRLDSSTFV